MAEKLRDGISRELRYVEYKLRKRKSDKNKKKQSPSIQPSTSSITEEFRQNSSNHGEEDIQLEIALAMSREEAKEKEQSEMSDKLRLEMALKESADVVAKGMAQHSPNRAQVDVTNNQAVDPWGAPVAELKKSTFAAPQQTAPVSNGFGNDAWGSSSTAPSLSAAQTTTADPWGGGAPSMANLGQPATVVASDPWGGTAGVTSVATNATKPAAQDPWGAPANPISLSAPPTKTTEPKADPWGSGEPTIQNADPWNSSSSAAAPDAWGGAAASSITSGQITGGGDSFDPFFPHAPAASSNPVNAFSQLSLQPSVASTDIFSSDILLPQNTAIYENTPNNPVSESGNAGGNKAGAFLGNNANLVNIDSLITKPATTHSYITMNSSGGAIGASRNPFNQKGPSQSLNQMKTANQNSFAGPTPNMMQPSTVPPMGFNMPLGGVAQPQNFGALGGVQPAVNPYFPQQSVPPTANQPNPYFPHQSVPPTANQPNQLLF